MNCKICNFSNKGRTKHELANSRYVPQITVFQSQKRDICQENHHRSFLLIQLLSERKLV